MSDNPKRIWLLPFDGEQRCWCDQPDPSGLGHEAEATEYVRADLCAPTLAEARYGHIAAFIRRNAMRHGATDDQVEDFLHGRADFIAWLADKIERPAPTLDVAGLVEAPISDARLECEALCTRFLAGEASEKEVVDTIKKVARANERLAVLLGEAKAAALVKTDPAVAFDNADWFWRTMDPDDSWDSPEDAINRAMVGRFCVCEIASSYAGPTRYGFLAPTLDDDDDEEFVHFATQQEAIDAAKERAALAAVKGGE